MRCADGAGAYRVYNTPIIGSYNSLSKQHCYNGRLNIKSLEVYRLQHQVINSDIAN